MPTSNFHPLSVNVYPRGIDTNCLAFALGIVKPRENHDEYDLEYPMTISEAFINSWQKVGFDSNTLRKISSIDEAKPDEYLFKVYDWTPYYQNVPFMGRVRFWNFHVLRRELDGSWVHKPGWDDDPEEVASKQQWDEIENEFGSKYVLFAAKSEGAV